MKKVLILSASPRIGGNSDVLCNEFIMYQPENPWSLDRGMNGVRFRMHTFY